MSEGQNLDSSGLVEVHDGSDHFFCHSFDFFEVYIRARLVFRVEEVRQVTTFSEFGHQTNDILRRDVVNNLSYHRCSFEFNDMLVIQRAKRLGSCHIGIKWFN